MSHRVVADISLSALIHNLLQIKLLAPRSKVLAMVKGNAYGHGMVQMARHLESMVDAFGVMALDDAIQLKNAGMVSRPIVILSGFMESDELGQIAAQGFEPVVHNFLQINLLENSKLKNDINVWLKLDTGMHRLGFPFQVASEIYQRVVSISGVNKTLRLMTHFSDADEVINPKTLEQLNCFLNITAKMDGEKSCANSAALLNFPQTHLDFIRPGLSLYGVSPITGKTAADFNLHPVMTLKSRIMSIHDLSKNSTVGYGSTWVCPEDMRIGIVSVGYGDGYPLTMQTGAPILVNNQHCQLIGRVAMDMINIDLRNSLSAKVGDEVVLWGERLPLELVASFSGSSVYELLTRLTSRVFYNYIA